METIAKQMFILIGEDCTGKTTFQKKLIKKLTAETRDARLDCNLQFNITNPDLNNKYETIFFINRSFQEKKAQKCEYYDSVASYFEHLFTEPDICILSSHLNPDDIREMIREGKSRFYNITGVFFTNSTKKFPAGNAAISLLDWDERISVENPEIESTAENFLSKIDRQLDACANSFIAYLIAKLNSR